MTDPCPTSQALSAYYDGELPAQEQAKMARHLAGCAACALEVRRFGQVSGLIASGTPAGLSSIARLRLSNKLAQAIKPLMDRSLEHRSIERGLVRWAFEVSGIAAAILLGSSIWLTRLGEPASAAAAVVPPWASAQASVDPIVNAAPSPAAAWYLADARSSSESNP